VSGYVLSVDADFDLDDIWEHIASDDIDAADRWVERLFEAFEALGQTDYQVSFWPVGAYLIIYRAAERRPIEIVAVTQGSRDIPGFFSRRQRL
jgi:plasmid stabilization system protein ParE